MWRRGIPCVEPEFGVDPMTFGRLLQLFILVPLCGALTVPVTSRVYWGYWWSEPPMERLTDQIASLDRFSSVHHDDAFRPDPEERRGSAALHRGAKEEDALFPAIAAGTKRGRFIRKGCDPMPSVCRALVARGLEPASEDAIPDARCEDVRRAVQAAGHFDADRVGGPMLHPIAHLAEGRGASGEALLLAAISSTSTTARRCSASAPTARCHSSTRKTSRSTVPA
jgi:hypothetical protein